MFYVLGAVVVLVFALPIYRLYFHPLAKYPGPLRYKLSSLPLLWQAYRGNRHLYHLRDHEKYGPIVRIAPDTLSFNTATALSTIYGSRNANVQKSEFYKTFDYTAGAWSTLTETDKDVHAAKRRWVAPIFSAESIKVSEPLIVDVIERFCETIKPAGQGWGEKWNATNMSNYLGYDIMGQWLLGVDFRAVQEKTYRNIADSLLPVAQLMYWISLLPFTALVRPLLHTKLPELIGGKAVAENVTLVNFCSKEIESRLEGKKQVDDSRADFLSRIINTEDKKTGWRPTRADLDTEALNLVMAGADPYASIMAAVFFYLVHNETVLKRATAEVRSTFSSPDEIRNGPKLNSCEYLYACIEETLRRAAAVPSLVPRVVMAGGFTVDGHHLPQGTVVGIPMYPLHHNPEYYSDPWSFRPERWLESETDPESIARARKAFAPFMMGTRQCSGRVLAYLQMKLTLAHILFRFDLRLSPEDNGLGGGSPDLEEGRHRRDEFQLIDAFGFGRDGPLVEVRVAE